MVRDFCRCLVLVCLAASCSGEFASCPADAPIADGPSTEFKEVKATLELVTDAAEAGEVTAPVIFVRQTIRNNTPHRLWVARSPLFEANCIRVSEGDRKAVRLSASGHQFAKASKRRGHSATQIAPKGKHETIIPLSRLFDISAPGIYTVSVFTKYSIWNDSKKYWTRPEPLTIKVAADGTATPPRTD